MLESVRTSRVIHWQLLHASYLIGALALSACQCDYTPERLPSIPETAVWAGGADGGAWIECFLDMEKSANWCTVWDDRNGHVRARTFYVLRDTGEPVTETELKYLSFSGVEIELADGRLLEPLKFHLTEEDELPPPPVDPPRK